MGVPRLFKYVCDRHPNVVKNIHIGNYNTTVNNLYIDSNALIHKAAQVVFQYGTYKPLLPICDTSLPEKEKETILFELFWSYLCSIVETVTPTTCLYIAIDGTAPVGKQSEQRKRRFVAARTRDKNMWNSSKISPGTLFMWELTKFINYSIRKTMAENPLWKNLSVIFSSHNVSGEGEHKLLRYIRDLPPQSQMTHCIWGPDGDLIMLSLLAFTFFENCPRFLWYREDNNNASRACIVDIGKLANRITTQWALEKSLVYRKGVVNDFILIGFFVGNDFLPKITMFHLLEEGFDVMLNLYHDIQKQHGTHFRITTHDNHIDMKKFALFVMKIAHKEKELLENQANRDVNDQRFFNQTLLDCTTERLSERTHKTRKILDYNLYRENYYKNKLHITSQKEIDKLCHNYIRGLKWVFEYYCNECLSYQWCYPYHYAPLFEDLSNYMRKWIINENKKCLNLKFVKTPPSEPFQQLLSILPPQSSNLLPREYASLITGSLSQYSPSEFEIDYEGVNKEYQGIPLLPFVNPDDVRKIYEKRKRKSHNYKRNEKGIVRHFILNENTDSYDYKSEYGFLKHCHVKVSIL